MRQIKFRAWNKTKRMMLFTGTDFKLIVGNEPDEGYELMQFTGLKDKNGKEIYEGDIVRLRTIKPYAIEWITFEDDEMGYPEGVGFNVHPEETQDMEVIGNIYETPELLTTSN